MNTKYVFITVFLLSTFALSAQTAPQDSTAKRKIPVQAFAAMPILLGVNVENAFSHDRKYKTFTGNDLDLPFENGQNYTIFGSLPLIRKQKGFSAKVNFAYNVFKDNIGTTTFNEQIIVDDVEGTSTSANVSFNISQQFLFKKWKKKLTLSAAFSASGKNLANFQRKTNRGIFSATLPLKMTKDNMFLIGAIGIVGKNIPRPVLPIVAYFTRLGSHLNLEVILPVSAQLRYVISPKSSIIAGARIGTRTPFMDQEIPVLQETDDALAFKSKNLRYYVNAEKALGKLVWVNAEVGYNRNIKEALIAPTIDVRNRFFLGDGFGYTYAKIGIFVRPVFGMLKKRS